MALRILLVCVGFVYLVKMVYQAPAQLRAAPTGDMYRRLVITRLIGVAVAVAGYVALVIGLMGFHVGMTSVYVMEAVVGCGVAIIIVSGVGLGWLEGRREGRSNR